MKKIVIIIANLDTDLSFQLKMQHVSSYKELIPRGLNIERSLIAQEATQAYKDNQTSSNSNEKPWFWDKKNNVTNDGVVDMKVVLSAPKKMNTQKMKQ